MGSFQSLLPLLACNEVSRVKLGHHRTVE